MSQAVQKLAGFFADAGASAPPGLDSSITGLNGQKLSASTQTGVSSPRASLTNAKTGDAKKSGPEKTEPAAQSERHLAGAESENSSGSTGAAGTTGTANAKGGVEGVVAAAIATERQRALNGAASAEELSIFQQVSKRYRILTPQIAKLPN